ncbi:hypothetical protein D9M68_653300 [compost metagenome]
MLVGNALHRPGCSLDVEGASCSDGDTTDVSSGPLPSGNDGLDHIASLEAECALASHEIAAREAVRGKAGPLIASPPCALDAQHRSLPVHNRMDVSDACSVEGVCLGDFEAQTVVLRLPASPGFDRQPETLEARQQSEAR